MAGTYSSSFAIPSIPSGLCQGCSRNNSPSPGLSSKNEYFSNPREASDEYTPGHETPSVKPELVHRWNASKGIMSLATSGDLVFAGTETGDILIYNQASYQLQDSLTGHQGSVFCLTLVADNNYLISGSSDSLIKIWSVESLQEVCTIYSVYDIGDIFSVAWTPAHERVFFGAQNASIQWFDFHGSEADFSMKAADPSGLPSRRFSKFFDSKGPGGKLAPQQKLLQKSHPSEVADGVSTQILLEVPPTNVVKFAHHGYVYCMISYTTGDGKELLISGSGDGSIKLWTITDESLTVLHTFHSDGGILAMAKSFSFCYCGASDGQVEMYDIETRQLLRVDKSAGFDKDVTSISAIDDFVFRCIGGVIQNWDTHSYNRSEWVAHEGLILASVISGHRLITGGADASVAIWEIATTCHKLHINEIEEDSAVALDDDQMIKTLRRFVGYETVSGYGGKYFNDCRRCAMFLRSLIKHFGGDAQLLPVAQNRNPIVLGKFEGKGSSKKAKILFYGHYDVIIAYETEKWNTPPYELAALDGYLYGRGVSDNKGPILAAIFAVAQLFQSGELENDVVFLIEGEEECGSAGFKETIANYLPCIGTVDWIILSNSYWLNDTTPCLTFGLRGVLNASVTIKSDRPDLHSGVHGGLYREPTIDMVNLLSKLTSDTGEILIPNFYHSVRKVLPTEEALYDEISQAVCSQENKEMLMARWRFPSLTVHGIDVSGPGNTTVIPACSTARISMRIVPDQDLEDVKESVDKFVREQFSRFGSTNHLTVEFSHEAEPWLGDPMNAAFQLLKQALKDEWGVDPLFIREGGSIPVIRWLEKLFDAPAVQLPCGQSSDGAHLDNERLRIMNFVKSRKVLRRAFKQLEANTNQPSNVL